MLMGQDKSHSRLIERLKFHFDFTTADITSSNEYAPVVVPTLL